MGVDAGVTVCFYKNGQCVKADWFWCHNFRENSGVYDVTEYDKIVVRFSTEFDDSCTDDNEEEEEEGEEEAEEGKSQNNDDVKDTMEKTL